MRRIGMALAAVALVAAVAGCGSSDEGQSNKSASPKPSKLDVSGIVVLDTTPGNSDSFSDDKSWQVMVFDPESGKQKLNLGLPVNAAVNDDTGFYRSEHPAAEARRSFSSDWQYAAYAKKNGAIEILHLDATSQRYVPQTTIKRPSGSYSGGKVTYRHPTFSPNGHRLWFSASPSEGKSKLMSVDYTSPGKPRDEGTLRTEGVYTKSWRLTADGTPIEESSGWRVVDGSGEAGKANT
ncbi:MAG: hypothetical protein ACRDQA_17825, partial [Nocardioidaceae bacterium]